MRLQASRVNSLVQGGYALASESGTHGTQTSLLFQQHLCIHKQLLHLAEDEVVYAHCRIHQHWRQEYVQEQVCRFDSKPDGNAVA